jgi:two-component system, sensor histidine kinase and response regulator
MQATELVHMVDQSLPVVALTAHALPEECERFAEAGMVAHIAKPFDPKALTHLILQHARRSPSTMAPPEGAVLPRMDPNDPRDFDLDGAMRRCGGKSELLHRLVAKFRDEQLDFMARCIGLLETAPVDAQHLAHRLKGTSANLGMPVLARHAGELESALQAQDAPAVALALQSLDGTLQQHIMLINEWLQKESATA